ncbi:MAG: glycoside hydrolase [Paludibacter sp.]|nr:glycoside hydrolase [Paludibacter sp.]
MKKKLCLIGIVVFVQAVSATNYGEKNLFAHIDFENNSANDLLVNVVTSNNNLFFQFDTERGNTVATFSSATKSNLQLITYPFREQTTLSFWFKRNDTDPSGNWRMAFATYAADGSNVYFTPLTSWNASSYLISESKPFELYRSAAAPSITNQEWVFVTIVFDRNLFRVYLNGEFASKSTNAGSIVDFNTVLHYFGNHPAMNYPMSGAVDDVKIFHSALTDNEIRALYQNIPFSSYRDPLYPSFRFPLDENYEDELKHVSATVHEIALVESSEGKKVAGFGANAYMSFNPNPIGNDKYSVAFLYKKERFQESDSGKILFKFSNDKGDYVALVNRYTPSNGGKLEMVKYIDGTLTKTGLSSNPIIEDKWNSIVLTQTYSATLGAYRLYINGYLVKTAASFYSNVFNFSSWTFGSAQSGETLEGQYDEICWYQREITPTEITRFNNLNTQTIVLSANPGVKFQTIRNFGASDGWSTQFVGKYFTEEQKNKIAEMLYSTEYDTSGNPKGIGLSAWRFNIGAGTAEQGTASRINTETRRTECFQNSDGTFNWQKQLGQQYFLKQAANYHVQDIIGWQNSPPVHYTVRGLGFREYGDPMETILKKEHYSDFGNFLADVILHFKNEGVNIRYISPLNEPQYAWAPSAAGETVNQEGTPWTNQNISEVVKAINQSFQNKGVEAKMFISEAGAISHHLSTSTGNATKQLSTFWNPSGNLQLTDVPSLDKIVSSHSYWEETNADKLVDTRVNFLNEMRSLNPELEFWQTEYSFLGTGYQWGHPAGTLTPMQSAVSLSRVIHADLTIAQATGWQWWTTFEQLKHLSEEDRYALIRVAFTKNYDRGIYNTTKLMYGLGSYSFFIRPGMKRIELTRSDNMSPKTQAVNQMFSAFQDEISGKTVIVATNFSQNDCYISLPQIDMNEKGQVVKYIPYITTEKSDDNMKPYPAIEAGDQFLLPKVAIVTFVGLPEVNAGFEPPLSQKKIRVFPNPANQFVNIESTTGIESFRIVDLLGKTVVLEECNSTSCIYNTDKLKEGVYLLSVKTVDGQENYKISIRR